MAPSQPSSPSVKSEVPLTEEASVKEEVESEEVDERSLLPIEEKEPAASTYAPYAPTSSCTERVVESSAAAVADAFEKDATQPQPEVQQAASMELGAEVGAATHFGVAQKCCSKSCFQKKWTVELGERKEMNQSLITDWL